MDLNWHLLELLLAYRDKSHFPVGSLKETVCDKINQMAMSKKEESVKPQLQGEKHLFQTKLYQQTVALVYDFFFLRLRHILVEKSHSGW